MNGLTSAQHNGIAYEAGKRTVPGTADYLVMRARLGALVFLGITYGVEYDGGPWWPFACQLAKVMDEEHNPVIAWDSEGYPREVLASDGRVLEITYSVKPECQCIGVPHAAGCPLDWRAQR